MSTNDPLNNPSTSSGDISVTSIGCDRIMYVRLPCNPIFPIGVAYLADHIHKIAPQVQQDIFDLGTVPP